MKIIQKIKSYIKCSAFFSLSMLVTHQAFSSPTPVETLEGIVNEGVGHAFGIKTQELRLEQSINRRWNSYFDLLPTLTLTGGRSISTTEQFSGTSKIRDKTYVNSLSMSANWTLWDNFQNIRSIQTSLLDVDAERLNSQKEIQSYIVSLLDAYLEYQLLVERKAILKNLLDQSKWMAAEAQELVKAGAKTLLDAMDTEVQVVNTERDILENDNAIASAERSLKAILNSENLSTLPQVEFLKLRPYFLPQFEEKLPAIKTDWAGQIASANPDIKGALLDVEKSRLERNQSRWNYLPKTSVKLSHDWNFDGYVRPETEDVHPSTLRSSTIALQFTWEVWDWFNTHRNISNSNRDFEITGLRMKETTLKVRTEMQNLLEQYAIMDKSIEASQMILEKTNKQHAYSQEMYRLGRLTLLNMQQSTNRLFEARTSLASRLKNKYILAAKIMYQTGHSLLPGKTYLQWAY